MQLHINTPGAYLHVKDQMFEIRLKQEAEVKKHLFAAQKVKSILLGTSAALSTDAVKLAMMHNVDIVFVSYDGHPYGRVWHSKLGSTTKIRKAQLEASLNETGLSWIRQWLAAKVGNQRAFLMELKKHRATQGAFIQAAADKLNGQAQKISLIEGKNVTEVADTFRGLEGTAGRIYFDTLSKLLAKEYQFSGRSYRPATDPFNAFLNYAYGMLYSKVEKALMIAGLDPYVGFMHRDDYNQLSFVFDFIEPYRTHADQVVYRLFSGKHVNQSHTDRITNGFSLNKEGKALLVQRLNTHLEEEKIRHNGRNLTRSHAMQLDAHQLANQLIGNFESKNDNEIITFDPEPQRA